MKTAPVPASGFNDRGKEPRCRRIPENISIPLEEAYRMIFTGQIVDGKSIIGIQYAFNHLVRINLRNVYADLHVHIGSADGRAVKITASRKMDLHAIFMRLHRVKD